MALRSVQAFGHDFDIAVERDREKLEITVQGRGLKRQQIAAKPNETIKIELTPIGVAD